MPLDWSPKKKQMQGLKDTISNSSSFVKSNIAGYSIEKKTSLSGKEQNITKLKYMSTRFLGTKRKSNSQKASNVQKK